MGISWPLNLAQRLARVAARPDDDTETRLNKTLLLVASLMMATLAIFWGSLYLVNGERLPASSAVRSSSTTSGVTQSTLPAVWNHTGCPEKSRLPRPPMNWSKTTSIAGPVANST